MALTTPDYVVLVCTAVCCVVGLLIGFSGSLAMTAGFLGSGLATKFSWSWLKDFVDAAWLRILAVIVLALLAFALVRLIVKKTVHVLLAQPGDALLGALCAGATGFSAALGAVWLGGRYGLLGSGTRSFLLERVLSLAGF